MRHEERQANGSELEREPQLARRNELEKKREDELPILDPGRRLDPASESLVVATMRAIFERRSVIINDLQLPQREQRALEALQAAVTGRDEKLSKFVYAHDRRELLEQALLVLQPGLIQETAPPLQDLVHHVGNLRVGLEDLDDAQDDLLVPHAMAVEETTEGDSDDKPDDEDEASAKPASTLDGPEVEEPPKPASTLDGPPREEIEKPPTSLGDAKEIAKIANRATTNPQAYKAIPWWKAILGGEK